MTVSREFSPMLRSCHRQHTRRGTQFAIFLFPFLFLSIEFYRFPSAPLSLIHFSLSLSLPFYRVLSFSFCISFSNSLFWGVSLLFLKKYVTSQGTGRKKDNKIKKDEEGERELKRPSFFLHFVLQCFNDVLASLCYQDTLRCAVDNLSIVSQ